LIAEIVGKNEIVQLKNAVIKKYPSPNYPFVPLFDYNRQIEQYLHLPNEK